MKINFLKKIFKDESGATAIEYGLIASLIAVAIIVGAKKIGDNLNHTFDTVANHISSSEPKK